MQIRFRERLSAKFVDTPQVLQSPWLLLTHVRTVKDLFPKHETYSAFKASLL